MKHLDLVNIISDSVITCTDIELPVNKLHNTCDMPGMPAISYRSADLQTH